MRGDTNLGKWDPFALIELLDLLGRLGGSGLQYVEFCTDVRPTEKDLFIKNMAELISPSPFFEIVATKDKDG